jgi:hypothetical protein
MPSRANCPRIFFMSKLMWLNPSTASASSKQVADALDHALVAVLPFAKNGGAAGAEPLIHPMQWIVRALVAMSRNWWMAMCWSRIPNERMSSKLGLDVHHEDAWRHCHWPAHGFPPLFRLVREAQAGERDYAVPASCSLGFLKKRRGLRFCAFCLRVTQRQFSGE